MSEFANINRAIAYAESILGTMDLKFPNVEAMIQQAKMDAGFHERQTASLKQAVEFYAGRYHDEHHMGESFKTCGSDVCKSAANLCKQEGGK